ncbi:esterase-like activity of phytase family protein [Qipengyuania mesophila]|uniref:esterase-like activity of phytase family protein n=1 Tax=Qipengyuania mesophila TaxID=2867246 RepID=UPI003513F79C
MRRKRLALAILLAAALAPGTWLRVPIKPHRFEPLVTITPLAVESTHAGPFQLIAGWQMTGDRLQFGGWSALVVLDGQRFLAGSDGGRRLVFERPDRSRLPGLLDRFHDNEQSIKEGRDLESLAIDPSSGTVWGGFEYRQSIVRFDAEYRPDGEVHPHTMRRWDDNAGPESLARLSDGRFLVIEEGAQLWRGHHHAALLFTGDPIDDPHPENLVVEVPQGYRPVDATPLGGGKALVLLRRLIWGVPPTFETALAVLDVDRRDDRGIARARLLAELGNSIPQDNYEGLAITEDSDGRHVWLISDDNFMSFQRTLLIELRWNAREKARE